MKIGKETREFVLYTYPSVIPNHPALSSGQTIAASNEELKAWIGNIRSIVDNGALGFDLSGALVDIQLIDQGGTPVLVRHVSQNQIYKEDENGPHQMYCALSDRVLKGWAHTIHRYDVLVTHQELE
jgi:hypothetical protein